MRKIFIVGLTAVSVANLAVAASPASPRNRQSKVLNKNVVSEADTLVKTLENINITANRALQKTPIAFSNISNSDLKKQNDGRDIPFIIQTTPSIVVTGDAGGGVGYSGIRVRGSDPSRINVTANGIPINDSESSRVYWVNMPDLVSSLKDIQIQRGVGTSTNGAGAFGASINMSTNVPSAIPSAEFATSLGTYNTNRQTLKVSSGRIADRWSADMRLSHIGSDGYIDRASSALLGYAGQLAYSDHATSVRLLAFGGKEKTYMAWDYASKEEMEKYGRRYNPCGKYTAADGSIAFYPNQYDNYAQHHFQLIGTHSISNRLKLNVSAHYTLGDGYYEQYKTKRTLEEYGLQPFIGADGNKVSKSDLIRLKNVRSHFGGGVVRLSYEGDGFNIVGGTSANWHFGEHFGQVAWVRNYVGAIDPLQRYYTNRGRKFDANAFVRSDISLSETLSAYIDLQGRHIRYSINGISDVFDWNTGRGAELDIFRNYNFFNPKAGLTYSHGDHRVFGSWSIANKEPVRDNFTDATPGHYPNPERMLDYECGWNWTPSVFRIGVGGYYMDYHNQLVLTGQLSDTGNPVSVNVPKSYRAGVELEGGWRVLESLDLSVNATLSRNRILDFTEYIYEDEWHNPIAIYCGDTPISFSPDLTANGLVSYHKSGFEATFATRYVSSQYMNNAASPEARLDAYTVSDLSLSYEIKNLLGLKTLRFGTTVYNIFNALYFNNGYTGAGYTVDKNGEKQIYRYAGFAAQSPLHFLSTITLTL